VRDGIPLLYPHNVDKKRLSEEEKLASMMMRPGHTFDELFSDEQWKKSKAEFWDTVKEFVKPPPKRIINVGCGYDRSFLDLQQNGHQFVNFDLVFHMLKTLKKDFGALNCVAGDISSLPFKPAAFDYLVCIDVIHHRIDSLPAIFDSFYNVLKEAGMIFLEDVNAWGIFQFPKSILLPKWIHGPLRSAYHAIKHSQHRPANYEFPTNVHEVVKLLRFAGFGDIIVHPNESYPNIGQLAYKVYTMLATKSDYVKRFHNFHYRLSATKLRRRADP
jgi:SAM-dependent methyltransferase